MVRDGEGATQDPRLRRHGRQGRSAGPRDRARRHQQHAREDCALRRRSELGPHHRGGRRGARRPRSGEVVAQTRRPARGSSAARSKRFAKPKRIACSRSKRSRSRSTRASATPPRPAGAATSRPTTCASTLTTERSSQCDADRSRKCLNELRLPVISRGARMVTRHPHLMANYARAEINFVRGEGVYLFDESGNRYLDFVAGIAVARSATRIRGSRARSPSKPRRWCTAATSTTTNRPGRWPTKLAELSGFERSSSAIRAPRRTRPRSSSRANSPGARARRSARRSSRHRFVPRPDVRRARRHRQRRPTRRASSRCRPVSRSRRSTTSPRFEKAIDDAHRRIHRRAGAGRERRRPGDARVSAGGARTSAPSAARS